MNTKPHADNLHRLVKYALDSGEAKTLDEAESLFQGYRLALTIHGMRRGTRSIKRHC